MQFITLIWSFSVSARKKIGQNTCLWELLSDPSFYHLKFAIRAKFLMIVLQDSNFRIIEVSWWILIRGISGEHGLRVEFYGYLPPFLLHFWEQIFPCRVFWVPIFSKNAQILKIFRNVENVLGKKFDLYRSEMASNR